MSPFLIGSVALFCVVLSAILGAPIGAAVGLVAALGLWATSGSAIMLVNLQTLPYSTAAEYAFIVVPMFVLMGNVASSAGIIESLFDAAAKWLSRVRGGLLMAVTLSSGGFAAVSGSTIVNAAVFTQMAFPQMMERGYGRNVSAALIAASGTFAVMIPPSLAFVLYAVMTGESVGKLFMAGVVPGLLTVAAYLIAIAIGVRVRPDWAPPAVGGVSLREKFKSLRPLWAIILLIVIVLGGIYTGFMPPSAAGAVGALGAIIISIVQRKFTFSNFWQDVRQAAILSSSIFFIVISGFLFARFMISSGFVPELKSFVGGTGIGKWQFIVILSVTYFTLGMFIDGSSMAVITLPFVYPIGRDLGVDGLWFGVLFVKLVEIGAITPPVGLNLFTVVAASKGRLNVLNVVRGIWPFVLIELIILAILIAFPGLSTWLPSTMR